MNDIKIIFCHGFGFNIYFWNNLLDYFQDYNISCLNLGYFNDEHNDAILFELERIKADIIKTPYKKIIGVGHSLGMIKLVQSGINFDALIGLNSFISFLGYSSILRSKRIKELDFFRQNLFKSPKSCLAHFYNRCGITDYRLYDLNLLNINKLNFDIDELSKEYSFKENIPTLVLGAKDDIVVPENVLHENFDSLPNVKLEILKSGKHGLGYLEYESVANRIKCFCAKYLSQ